MDDKRLPIKIIMPKQGKQVLGPRGGGEAKPFRLVDSAYRERLSNQIGIIRENLPERIEKTGGVPARVSLIPRAIAKTHRPERLFSKNTCPIIGAGSLGELFIKATPSGLDRLNEMVKTDEGRESKQLVKELSAVDSIEPVTPEFRLGNVSAKKLLEKSPKKGDGFALRVKLFDFGPDSDRGKLVADFKETCEERGIKISRNGYSQDSFTCAAKCRNAGDVKVLSGVIGVRSVRRMPLIRSLRPQSLDFSSLPALPVRSDYSDDDVPVVAVVDTGISDELPQLGNWVFGHRSYVEPSYGNTEHGTFVAALVCCPAVLNPSLKGISSGPCGIFNLQIIPNDDPAKGNTDSVDEQEFLISLESSLKKWADKCKVWNLSLNTDDICSLDEFSELAQQLDKLQEKYGVLFVVSAGNCRPPFSNYPRTPAQQEYGRITSPADTVLGITVGSISHVDYGKSGPKENEPSPFSRNGSGPNHIIKPDLVHYGGSCSTDASHMDGIRSINGTRSVENLGTSFAAPLVSRTLAQICHYVTPAPSPVLARALLTHHSRDPRTGDRVLDGEEKYFGFGRPEPVPYCLECTRHSSTLVVEEELIPGYSVEWDDFPYPPSLYQGGCYHGEIWMTLAFAPMLGTEWGAEYCETHIQASLGVYYEEISRSTGEVTTKYRGLVPLEHRNPGELYETHQVANLRKWAPVRTYHTKIGPRGRKGLRWRLKLSLLARHDIDKEGELEAQPFCLIITISDPKKEAPVYDEMARIVRNQFDAQNLVVKMPVRIETRV